MTQLVRTAAPLAIAAGLTSLSGNVPRYFLERLAGVQAVGLFSLALASTAAISLFTATLSQATLARASTHFQRGNVRDALRIAFLPVR